MTEEVMAALKVRNLVGVYREAFGLRDNGEVDEPHKLLMKDLEEFCGLRQAKFEGDQHEIIKAMGRIEVLGRIKYFLEMPERDYLNIVAATEMDDE